MRRLENTLSVVLEAILALGLLAIFLLVVALVITRYVFNAAIPGATESITIIFIYISSIGGALAAGRRGHVAIPFAIENLPKQTRRWIDTSACCSWH